MQYNSNTLAPGTILREIYRLDSHISSGGFGNTYKATNIAFNETVAIKEFFMEGVSMRDEYDHVVVPVENNRELFSSQMEKFMKEAQRIRKLNNPHIVRVLDIFSANDTVYYVMDFIKGKSLGSIIERRGYPMHEEEVINLLPQVLDALQTVHEAGLLHLDIKPDNLMLGDDGVLRLIDFGASKQNLAQGGTTKYSAVAYTERYAPLEQMFQNTDRFGPGTDFYALGATMLNLLSNNTPPTPSEIMYDKSPDKRESIQIPTTVSDLTRQLILWLMEVNIEDRPQSVKEIRDFLNLKKRTAVKPEQEKTAVQPIQNQKPPVTFAVEEIEVQEEDESKGKSHKKVIYGSIAAALLACILIWAFLIPKDEPPAMPAEAEEIEDYEAPEAIVERLASYLDEKNSQDFNKEIAGFEMTVYYYLKENENREGVYDYVSPIWSFLEENKQKIADDLSYSSETTEKVKEITKGTEEDYIKYVAEKNNLELPDKQEEDNNSEKTYKTKQRLW